MALITMTPATASRSPVSLLVPQSTAFGVLGHSCGGIQEKAFASRFDPASGYPDGDVYLSTTCSTGGRGGHPKTYKAWVATTWDFTGALVSFTTLQQTPTVDPTLSVFDSHGNQIYNQSNRAYLVLAPGFVAAPRVSGVSPASGPQGSSITIIGTGFTGATAVNFGAKAAVSFTINGDTSITAITPAVRTGTDDVSVTNSGGTSAQNPGDRFTFVPQPRVSFVNPNQGSADGGTKVTITGVNFTAANAVSFGGVAASFTVTSDSSITAVSPPGPDSGVTVDVTVTSPSGTSAVSASDRFTYT
jgi:hypothetical protein